MVGCRLTLDTISVEVCVGGAIKMVVTTSNFFPSVEIGLLNEILCFEDQGNDTC